MAMPVHFGAFVLDVDTRQLLRDGVERHLSGKAFDLLRLLVKERPKVLPKDALQAALWPDTFVSEANLSNLVAELRSALDDNARAPQFIRTVHGVGYAFSASVTVVHRDVSPALKLHQWLEWGGERFLLTPGEHVLGRDETAQVQLNHSTVSRRHARVLVTAEGTSLEDLNSKNGTFRGEIRVTTPVALSHGDHVRIGSVRLIYWAHSPLEDTTLTHGDPG